MKITLADRFKTAGKELLSLNVGNVAKSFGLPDYELYNQSFFIGGGTNNYPTGSPENNSGWMFGQGGTPDFYFDFNSRDSSLIAFRSCPPVSAILMQKAQAFINGDTFVMGTDGKESVSPIARKIKTVLSQPNPLQSGEQFEMFVYLNTCMFGYTVILPFKPVGFDGSYTTQLWALPGNMVEVEMNDTAPFTPGAKPYKSITFVYGSERKPLLVDEVFIVKDSTPSFTTLALPDSRIQLLSQPINNIIGALQSRGVLIANRGPRYIISNGAGKDQFGQTPMTPDELTDLQNKFKYTYGLLAHQSQAIITTANTNVNAIGYDVKQLGLMEEVQESSSMVCIGLGFPKFLAGLSDPTFNNQDTAEKALYQRFIMPEARNIYGQLNKFFNADKYGLNIIKDYSKLPVLQENMIDLGRARYYMNQACQIEFLNNIITYNEWRVLNGMDTIPNMDKYYYELLATGMVFGQGKPAPTDSTTNENNNNNGTGNQ